QAMAAHVGQPAMPQHRLSPSNRGPDDKPAREPGGPPTGTAILSYFTLPNSNLEDKRSPIGKIAFFVRSFRNQCLKIDLGHCEGSRPGNGDAAPPKRRQLGLR